MIKYIETTKNISFCIDGKSYSLPKTLEQYNKIKQAILEDKKEYLVNLIELVMPFQQIAKDRNLKKTKDNL